METRDPQQPELADHGEFSNFFSDAKTAWDRYGTPIVGGLAIIAIVYAGYNIITNRAVQAQQNAWIDLYTATSPESLEVIAQTVNRPAVRTVANLRAADLLVAEAGTATEEDSPAILETAKSHYTAALEEADHVVYRLNALDGLGVVAESLGQTEEARSRYQELSKQAGTSYPFWATLAERRLSILDRPVEIVDFAPERPASAGSDALLDSRPDQTLTPQGDGEAPSEADPMQTPQPDDSASDDLPASVPDEAPASP